MSTQSTLTYSLFLRPSTEQDTFRRELFIQSNNSIRSVPQQRYSGTLILRPLNKCCRSDTKRRVVLGQGYIDRERESFTHKKVVLKMGWSQGCGLSLRWSVTKVVCHQGGLSPRWSVTKMVSSQGFYCIWCSGLLTVSTFYIFLNIFL